MNTSQVGLDPRLFRQIDSLQKNIEKVIVGKPDVVKLTITALIARGHILIEDVPGVGKTALAEALSRSISCQFRRIQFTPDLLPSDITGISILDPEKKSFVFKPGPIFANIILADEINRTTPRTQSALLEAMNEKTVTVDGTSHPLPHPFMIIATQNPLEYTGTYPLPESQLDRFLFVLKIGYPTPEEEMTILHDRRHSDPLQQTSAVLTSEEAMALSDAARNVHVEASLTQYLIDIVQRTRDDASLISGVSPRGTLHLYRAVQAYALACERDYVTPDDIKTLAPFVLSHRILEKKSRGSLDGRARSAQIIQKILKEVPVPL